jgi:hypothetical protein
MSLNYQLQILFFVLIVPVPILMSVIWFIGQNMRRKRRLERRGRISMDELLDRFDAHGEKERRLVRKVLRLLGWHLHVEATVLRPADRFDHELKLSRFVGIPDGPLWEFFDDLKTLMKRDGMSKCPAVRVKGKTLYDLVLEVRRVL